MESAVVYLGHIPHGLYEEEMNKYFSQFGTVTRLKLARSKKTGRSKGFAFIEFECDEVAKIVAESMNNYLLFNKLLQCHQVPSEDVHEGMFATTRPWKQRPTTSAKGRSPQQYSRQVKRLRRRDTCKRRKLAAMGVDYQFSGYGSSTVTPTHTVFED